MTSTATVHVRKREKSRHRINPYIFGHFVEDIRDHYDAMLAYTLKNMDFEEQSGAHAGLSGSWYPITNGRNTTYALEPAAPRHSGHAQKIRIMSDDQCYGGIAQRVAVKGNIGYSVTLYARASIEIKAMDVQIVDRSTQALLCSQSITVVSHDWHEYATVLMPLADCNNAEFRVIIRSEGESWLDSVATGMIWLDHISMLCEDRVGVVKREVFEKTKDLNAAMMRIGGNHISTYHWKHGVGPMYERPHMINEAWHVMAIKTFGTDEFLQFCQSLEVEPLICVNDGTGTPEEAAQWVEYCNGAPDTPMGALRCLHGHPEPYHVTYWEVGNEVWGPWQAGHCTAEAFAERFVAFAKAMKAADPTIKLLACGDTDPEWNATVLEIAGEYIDYLTIHLYQRLERFGFHHERNTKEEIYKAIVSFPEFTRAVVEQCEAIIGHLPNANHVKLAITEHNTMYYPSTTRKGLPNEHTLEAAVANAANFNEFIRRSDLIEIGSFSDLVNGWLGGCIRVGDFYADQYRGKEAGWTGKSNVVFGTPTYHVMKLYANRKLAHVIGSEVECDVFQVTGHTEETKLEQLPVLDVVSCLNEDEDVITVFAVNRSLQPVDARICFDDFEAEADVHLFELTGDDAYSINDVFEPDNVVVVRREASADAASLNCKLNAHSVYVFELKVQ